MPVDDVPTVSCVRRDHPAGLPAHVVLPVLPMPMKIISPAAWVDKTGLIVEPVPPGFVGVESLIVGKATLVRHLDGGASLRMRYRQ